MAEGFDSKNQKVSEFIILKFFNFFFFLKNVPEFSLFCYNVYYFILNVKQKITAYWG